MADRHVPYLGLAPRREIKEFITTITIQGFSTSIITLFEPIYLWTLGFTMPQIMLYYVAVYAVYFFLLPLGGKLAKRFGYEHLLFAGTIALVVYFLALLSIGTFPWMIGVAALTFAIQKMLYWPAYHGDLARFGRSGHRARELSVLFVLFQVVAVIGPVVGGFILDVSSFSLLFLVASGLLLASVIPLFTTREKFRPSPFSYREALRYVFKREHRRRLLAYFGFGEELIVLTVWPIFIFLIVGDFFSIGSIIAGATIFSIIVTLIAGRFADTPHTKHATLVTGTLLYTVSFLARVFGTTTFGVFLFDSFSRMAKTVLLLPFVSSIYERAKQDHVVMHEVVFFEMALSIGKAVAALIVAGIFLFTESFFAAFAVAGAFALFYLLLRPVTKQTHG